MGNVRLFVLLSYACGDLWPLKTNCCFSAARDVSTVHRPSAQRCGNAATLGYESNASNNLNEVAAQLRDADETGMAYRGPPWGRDMYITTEPPLQNPSLSLTPNFHLRILLYCTSASFTEAYSPWRSRPLSSTRTA